VVEHQLIPFGPGLGHLQVYAHGCASATSRAARFQSGLSLFDFLKRTSILKASAGAYAILGPHTVALAEAEGLPAHALSASLRMKAP